MKGLLLKNRYLLMRHGESIANVLGVISSHPTSARTGAGLSPRGCHQVTARCEPLRHEIQRKSAAIYSSDFRRARESAEIVAQALTLPPPVQLPMLRERGFGALDGLSTSFYPLVWARDGAGATLPGVEPVQAVAARMWSAIHHIEGLHTGSTILLLSHGDPIQILLADNILGSALQHRELPGVVTAEVRALQPD